MNSIKAKVSNPDFLLCYKFFSTIGKVNKLQIIDNKKVKVCFDEPVEDLVLISIEYKNSLLRRSFNSLYRHLLNYGKIEYIYLDEDKVIVQFKTVNDMMKAYQDLKRYTKIGYVVKFTTF